MEIIDFGFYTVDKDYVKELYETDNEVFFDEHNYEKKPYVGIMIFTGKYNYFLPLTSAKLKHTTWKLISKESYVIYENVPKASARKDWIYVSNGDDTVRHIISVLDIKKMIPVPNGKYRKIIFSDIENSTYSELLTKEYRFLKPYANDILMKANKLYSKQKETNKINRFFCNYTALEKICDKYSC